MSTKNIVIFGKTGAGQSSVINLMAGREQAKTSPDMEHCTMQWEEHAIEFDGYAYRVFDTVGLDESHLGMKEYLDIIVNTYNLITKLQRDGGIDLLMFCVRAGRNTATALQSNYRLFHECLCDERVPIVLVLTGLEMEQRMEDWWDRNKVHFMRYKIDVVGHACITAANKLDGRHQRFYEDSRRLVRDLVIEHTRNRQGGAYSKSGGDESHMRVMQVLRELTPSRFAPKKKDIVTVLIKRCRIPPDAAKELASKIRFDPTK
jgi:hypothetical protein